MHHPPAANATTRVRMRRLYLRRVYLYVRVLARSPTQEDPLGGAEEGGPALCDDDFHWITERLTEVADATCNGRIVSVLEGGYDPQVLRRCVAAHVRALSGARPKVAAAPCAR